MERTPLPPRCTRRRCRGRMPHAPLRPPARDLPRDELRRRLLGGETSGRRPASASLPRSHRVPVARGNPARAKLRPVDGRDGARGAEPRPRRRRGGARQCPPAPRSPCARGRRGAAGGALRRASLHPAQGAHRAHPRRGARGRPRVPGGAGILDRIGRPRSRGGRPGLGDRRRREAPRGRAPRPPRRGPAQQDPGIAGDAGPRRDRRPRRAGGHPVGDPRLGRGPGPPSAPRGGPLQRSRVLSGSGCTACSPAPAS